MKVEMTVRDYRPMINKRVRKYVEESDVFVHGIILFADDKGLEVKTDEGLIQVWQESDCDILEY
jgi:hypothetical protein